MGQRTFLVIMLLVSFLVMFLVTFLVMFLVMLTSSSSEELPVVVV